MPPDVLIERPARSRPGGAALWAPVLDRSAALPLSRQLAAALRAAIAEGRLGAGARLPSTRALAAEIGLARSTVVAVFEQLAAEGYIAAQPGSGYFVPAALADARPGEDAGGGAPAARPMPRPVSRHGALLRELNPQARTPPRPFELGHADIDPRLVAVWKRLASRVLSGRTRLSWQYGDPQGEPVLRQAIAEYLAAARGVRCRPEQVVVTSGTQQGLSLAARVLLDPGDRAWVEDPCYRAALDILRLAGARYRAGRGRRAGARHRRRAAAGRAKRAQGAAGLHHPVAAIPARHGDAAGAAHGAARLGRGGGRLDHRG